MNILNKIVDYYRTEPNLAKYTLIVLGVCVAVTVLLFLIKAMLNRKRAIEEEKKILLAMKDAEAIENFDDVQNIEQNRDNSLSVTQNDTVNADTLSDNQKNDNQPENVNQDLQSENNVKTEAEPNELKSQEKEDTRYAGKWLIKKENGRFLAELTASNGEILLRTENYSALSGIKSGIETVKNNIAKDNIAISLDKNGNFFFKVYSSATRLLCISEGYSTKSSCERAIESVKRFSKTAVVVREQPQEDQQS